MYRIFFLLVLFSVFFMPSAYSQTSKQTLRCEERIYDYKESDAIKKDTLVYEMNWDLATFNISETDSLYLSKILLNFCSQGKQSIQVSYWDFDFSEYSERLSKRKGMEIFRFLKKYECFEYIDMVVYYYFFDIDEYPYDQYYRVLEIVSKE